MYSHAPNNYQGVENDDLHRHMLEKNSTTAEKRLPYVKKIKEYLKFNQ